MKKNVFLLFFLSLGMLNAYCQEIVCGDNARGISLCYYKNSVERTNEGFVRVGILSQDYGIWSDLNKYDNRPILVKKGSKVTFYQTFDKSWNGTLWECTLGEGYGLPCFGVPINSVVFPKGSVIEFYITDFKNEEFKRVLRARLGADAVMPRLGQCRKGDTILFSGMSNQDPNIADILKE